MPLPQLSPELQDVGLAIGLMLNRGGNPRAVDLNDDFFSHPDSYLGGVFTNPDQRAAVLRLAGRLLEGDAGQPDADTDGESWLPLATAAPNGNLTCGVFLVTADVADDLLISLGGQLQRADDITLRLVARVPLFLVSETGASFAPGTDNGDVRVEATVELGDVGPIDIERITAGVTIPTDGDTPEAVVRLVRPPEGDAGDIVATTTDPVGAQAARVLSQLVTALADQAGPGAGNAVQSVLRLLGLDTASGIPALPLEQILSDGRSAVWQWILDLFSSPTGATVWIDELADLLGVTVSGTGTTASPWQLCFAAGPLTTCLELSATTESGSIVVVPALRASLLAPAGLGVAGKAELAGQLVRLRLGPNPSAGFEPNLAATVTVGTISGSTALVSTPLPGISGNVSVGALRTGLAVDAAGARLLLEAHRVTFPNVPVFPVLDLTDTDALLDAGGAILDGAISGLLTALGNSPAARTIFVLLGLQRPAGTTATSWPHEVTISELFNSPVDAVRDFHLEVHAAGDAGRLVDELGGLLRAAGGVAGVTGTGTATEPWTVTIASGTAGRADLIAWTTTDADGTRLHLGSRLELPATAIVGGAQLGFAITAEVVSLRLAGVGGVAAGLDPLPLPSLSATVELGEDLTVDVGPLLVLAHRISAGIDWSPRLGLAPHFSIAAAELAISGATIPLPVPFWDAEGKRFRFAGDVPWPIIERLAAQLLESLANQPAQLIPTLLGWRTTGQSHAPAIPPPPGSPAVPYSTLSLEDLVRDPWRALGRTLVSLLTSGQGREWADALFGWVATLTQGLSNDVLLTGSGATADPWAVPLTGSGRALELIASVGDHGGALGGVAARVTPPELLSVIELDDATEVTIDVLARALAALALLDSQVAALARRSVDPAISLAALRTALLNTDGLVPASAQHGIGSVAGTINGVGQLGLPALFADSQLPTGAPAAAGRVFVRTAIAGTAAWPAETSARTVDLTAPNLPPESFDLTTLPAAGPWFVLLPTRLGTGAADRGAGHTEQVNRLRRVVDAFRAGRPSGSPLALIAQGPAGHVALAVASDSTAGVTHLTLLGTSIATTPASWADATDAGDGLRLVQGLRDLSALPPGLLAEADELLGLLAGLTDGPPPEASGSTAGAGAAAAQPYPLGDVAPPAGLPALPSSVAVRTVAANLDAATLDLALGRLFAGAIQARLSGSTAPDELRIGVRAKPVAITANGVRAELSVGLDVVTLPLDFADLSLSQPGAADHHPRLRVGLRLDRPSGWLVGGPTGVPVERRDPRLRALDADVAIDLVDGSARCDLVLHDAAGFGIPRAGWPLSLSVTEAGGLPAHLTQEDRLLLGELATALGPKPASGALAALMDGLVALGLAELDSSDQLTLLVDPVEQLLLDARSVLPALTADARGDLAAALAGLTGGSASARTVSAPLGTGATLTIDLATPASPVAVTVATLGPGIALFGGVGLSGSATLTTAGTVALAMTLTAAGGSSPNGRLGLTLTVDSTAAVAVTAALTRTGGVDGLARSVALLPTPDVPGLEALASAAMPAELLRLALEFGVREVSLLGPVLDALRLRDPTTQRVLLPAGLMADPAKWLTSTATLGASTGRPDPAKISGLFAAVRAFVPGPHPVGGVALPWGAQLLCTETAGTLRITVSCPPVGLGALRVSGSAGVALDPAGTLSPLFTAMVDLTDPANAATVLGGLDVSLGTTVAVSARLPVGSSITTFPILPASGGLGDLVTQTVTKALPLALDALTRVGTFGGFDVGAAAAAVGDALGLRTGSPLGFDLAQLESLAANPVAQLASRLSAASNRADLAAALRLFADPLLPGTAAGTGAVVDLALNSHLEIVVDLSGSVPAVRVIGTDLRPIPELSIGGEFGLGSGGVRAVRVSVDLADPTLLQIGSTTLLPGVSFSFGPDTPRPAGVFEVRLWTAPPSAGQREALVVIVDLVTGPAIRWRSGGSDLNDPLLAAFGLARSYLIPLAAGLVLELDEVRTVLERNLVSTTTKLGQLLDPHVLSRTAGTPATYRLSLFDTAANGSFSFALLLRRVGLAAAAAANALLAGSGHGGLPLGDLPLTVHVASLTSGGTSLFGVGVDIPADKQFVLFDAGDVRLSLEVVDDWLSDSAISPPTAGTGRGLELYALRVPTSGDPTISPRILLRGLGVRIDKAGGSKLIDLGLTIRSIGVHGYLDKDLTTPAVRLGGHLELDQFGIPLGDAGGNPVASNFMQPSSDEGDSATLAPAFSPALAVVSKPTGSDVDIVVRAGPGDGPWWLPIQRAFGPLYVEQVGLGIDRDSGGDPETVSIYVDGGASLAGLTVQVDDLQVIIPWDTPGDLTTWRLDLAGIAVGYDGGGVTVAGGLRKLDRGGQPDYLGMLRVTFTPYGLTAVGGYGVFPDGAGGDYVSFFGFGAVTAPIGGPPAFFVTGLGGGMGVNRRLIAPTIEQVSTFILVQALDPFSSLAQDPMGALDQLGTVFPPERGAIWFAAGVSFTSFSLVYSTVVLTIEVHDGLEINLLGLARMALPNPAFPVAQIELALQARMSTAEGVFSVQAQLTENSWLINESCRLTGGFAFVMWFKGPMSGQFVLSMGGYHPDFVKPAAFPSVPRLGFAWEPGFGVSIKGGAYFALTATCVMAGGSLEASYKSSVVWASLEAGVDILVSWDPFFYDFKVYVRISAGIDVEVCFIVCGHVRMSFNFSASLHILGPKLRGSVFLDLDVTSVTISFGPSGSTNSKNPLSFAAFRDKYLRSGDDGGNVLAASITAGQVPPPASQSSAAGSAGQNGQADDGSAARPWKVGPEYSFFVQTRAATNAVTGLSLPSSVTGRHLDLGPANKQNITSTLTVRVAGTSDVTGEFTRTAALGKVPEATWTVLPATVKPDAKVIDSVVGLSLVAKVDFATDTVTVQIERVEISTDVKPLPFGLEAAVITANKPLGKLRAKSAGITATLSAATDSYVALTQLSQGAVGDSRLATAAQRADRISPPRLVALTDGIADTARAAVKTSPFVPPDEPPVVLDTATGPPKLAAWLRAALPVAVDTAGPVFTTEASGARVPAPTLDDVAAEVATPLGAWLRLSTQGSPGSADTKTVMPIGRVPVTGVAGLRRERVRSLRSDPDFAAIAARLDKVVVSAPVPLRAGDALILALPNSRQDRSDERPMLQADGLSVRVVSLGRTGEVLADGVIGAPPTGGLLEPAIVPEGAEHVAVLGGADPAGRFAGWLADGSLVQVSESTYLGGGCTLVTASAATQRRHGTVTTSVVRARDAVVQASSALTQLPADVRTVLVVLDGSAADLPEVAIGGGVAGGEPQLVQLGERTAMALGVDPGGDQRVSVTVADQRTLAGVLGSSLPVDAVVAQLAAAGSAAFGPLNPTAAVGAGTIRWRSP